MPIYEVRFARSITSHPMLVLRTSSKRRAIAEARKAIAGLELRGGGGVWVNRLTGPGDWDPFTIWAWGEGVEGGFGYQWLTGGTYTSVRRPRFRPQQEEQ